MALASQASCVGISLAATLLMGGPLHSGGTVLVGLMGPLYALAFPNRRRARWLLAAYLASGGVGIAAGDRVPWARPLPGTANLALFALMVTTTSVSVFAALYFFVHQRDRAMRLLQLLERPDRPLADLKLTGLDEGDIALQLLERDIARASRIGREAHARRDLPHRPKRGQLPLAAQDPGHAHHSTGPGALQRVEQRGRPDGGLGTFSLLAIPMFVLAGNLMNQGGITLDLVNFARLLMGHIRGGLGHATILACAIFAAISGSAVATAVAIGVVMIPAMQRAGYDDHVAAALTSTAVCLGPIIPPSIPFIIYGVTANVSIGALFLGGVLPGIGLALALMVYMSLVAAKHNYPRDPKAPLKEILLAAYKALPALFMPVLIMGGILSGMFTPTEASGVTLAYAAVAPVRE